MGSKFFVESVKASLDFRARGRDTIESDEGYQLRERPASYMAFFEAKNEDIAPENTVFLDVKGKKSVLCRGPTPCAPCATQDGAALKVSVEQERCIVRYQHKLDDPLSRYDVDLTVGLLANIINSAKASVQGNLKLYFPSASAAITPVETVRCIGSNDGRVEFDQHVLNRPMALYEETTYFVLERFYRINVNHSYRNSGFEGIVECILTAMIGMMKPSLQATSTLLGIGVRRLQRQLRREGTSFRELRDRVRQKAALHDMALGKSMTDIAFKLGYDHSSNFSTAFRRWFGQQPSTYRFDVRDPQEF